MTDFTTGCLLDPAIRDACVADLTARGKQPIAASNDSIRGAWQRLKERGVQAVLMPQLMAKYFPGRLNDFQNGSRNAWPAPDNGTCVARGTYRACTLSYLRAIDERQIVGKPVLFAYETIFGGGRVQIGRGQLGRRGGMYGGWAAQWVSQFGNVARDRYGRIDLSDDTPLGRSDLATEWGERGVPESIVQEARQHPFDAHLAMTVDAVADCLACGFAGAFSRSWSGEGARNQFGMVRPSPSAHCETLCGVVLAHNGETGFLHWQSHGENKPSGNNELQLYDGTRIPLMPGVYGVYEGDMETCLQGGESWHFECREGSQYR